MASLIAALATVSPAHADVAPDTVKRHGATFEKRLEVDGQELTLSGVGVLKMHGLFKIYVAGLYVDMRAPDFDSAAKRLDVHYLVNAKAKRFNTAGERILRSSMGDTAFETVKERYEHFSNLYPDSRKGDRCSVFWKSGSPIQLTYNGDALGQTPGDDFAKCYLDIWLGTAPADISLRNRLRKGADKQWPGGTE